MIVFKNAERKAKEKFARIEYETDEIIQQKDKLAEQNRNITFLFRTGCDDWNTAFCNQKSAF